MSNAVSQIAGQGGKTGKGPEENEDESADERTEDSHAGDRTGEVQAAENRENDPPA